MRIPALVEDLINPWKDLPMESVPYWVKKLAYQKYRGREDVTILGKHLEYRMRWSKKKVGTYHSAHDGEGADFDIIKYVSPSFQRRRRIRD